MTSTSFALSPNTAYTAHFVRQNFGFAETSYILGTLGDILLGGVDKDLNKSLSYLLSIRKS
jgi:hypothetical protein